MPRTPSRRHDEPLQRTSLRLPTSLWQRARLTAMANNMTWQDFVEDAITAHLERFDNHTHAPNTDGTG